LWNINKILWWFCCVFSWLHLNNCVRYFDGNLCILCTHVWLNDRNILFYLKNIAFWNLVQSRLTDWGWNSSRSWKSYVEPWKLFRVFPRNWKYVNLSCHFIRNHFSIINQKLIFWWILLESVESSSDFVCFEKLMNKMWINLLSYEILLGFIELF
jgi:hypothetical protein